MIVDDALWQDICKLLKEITQYDALNDDGTPAHNPFEWDAEELLKKINDHANRRNQS